MQVQRENIVRKYSNVSFLLNLRYKYKTFLVMTMILMIMMFLMVVMFLMMMMFLMVRIRPNNIRYNWLFKRPISPTKSKLTRSLFATKTTTYKIITDLKYDDTYFADITTISNYLPSLLGFHPCKVRPHS